MDDACIICMEGFTERNPAHNLSCGHPFHFECILSWAQSDNDAHDTCPVCRMNSHRSNPYQIQSSFSWQTLQNKQKCETLMNIVVSSRGGMSTQESQLLDYLMKQYKRVDKREKDHRKEVKEFNKINGSIVSRYRTLQARTYKIRSERVNRIRDILHMFPVVTVVKPRAATPAVVLRRSQRLEVQQDQSP